MIALGNFYVFGWHVIFMHYRFKPQIQFNLRTTAYAGTP